MKSAIASTLRTAGFVALGTWFAVGAALAQTTQGNGGENGGSLASVPTLDGFGLAALAGVLSLGGAWLLSRGNDKHK
ncbi:MAG TPA: hypothetical protein VN923_04290 [Thermoanaerobaculia bacterium]|nr:hypothetical protein [Thermoanaerobaculia bacterium]